MAKWWFILSKKWSLEDVQAALNVIISVLSASGIFTLARFCWQNATLDLAKQRDVPVASLLSVTSPGEAMQVIWFLSFRSITGKRYRKILVQSLIIFGLSVAAVLSGLITRFASHRGYTLSKVKNVGALANTQWKSMMEADVQWSQTKSSLAAADFPLDQLLDFRPDPTVAWVYVAEEWNNSWHASCNFTPATPIDLYATGNYSTGDWFTEIPALNSIVPDQFGRLPGAWMETLGAVTQGWEFQDVLMFLFATTQMKEFGEYAEDINMGILITAIHLHDAPMAPLNSTGTFGIGPVGSASYTRTVCHLQRPPSTINKTYLAFPNLIDPILDEKFAMAIELHYHVNFILQQQRGQQIWVPTGEDMFRFYQAYMICKDTQELAPVTRLLSTQVPTVELSTVFLAVMLLIALLIIIGLVYHAVSFLRHRSVMTQMPESKLDWLLQSLKEAERINNASEQGSIRRRSSTSSTVLKTAFESATYRWIHLPDEEGKKPCGEVVLREDVEMDSPSQGFLPFNDVDDKVTLLERPERTGWHY